MAKQHSEARRKRTFVGFFDFECNCCGLRKATVFEHPDPRPRCTACGSHDLKTVNLCACGCGRDEDDVTAAP
jgi:ribosomal protein S27E